MTVEVVTFDCYGTLIDWEGGMWAAFAPVLRAAGVGAGRERVIELHARHEPAVQAQAFRPYREVLAEVARRVLAELGAPGAAAGGDGAFLADSLPSWPPFADTNAALERMAGAGIRLGILSNIDDDLIAATRRHFTVPFEPVVTAAQVRSYKPAHGHWQEARRRLPAGARWLHAAQSLFHDIVPATALGLPTAWVNRKAEARGDARPTHEVPDLAGLAELLCRADRP